MSAPIAVPTIDISAFFGAALLCLLNHILRHWRVGGIRFLWIGGLALQPFFLRQCIDGSSNTIVAFLTLVSAYGLALWMTERKLRALVLIGVGGSLLFLSSLAMALWLLIALGALACTPSDAPPAPSERGAVGILILWPILYAIGLWALANWLILGDGFYLFRSLALGGADTAMGGGMLRELVRQAAYCWPAGCMVLLLGAAVRKRDLRGLSLGLIGLCPLAVAALLAAFGYLWDPTPVLVSLVPLAILALGYVHRLQAPSPAGRRVWIYGTMVFCAFTLALYRPGAGAFGRILAREAAEIGARDSAWLSQIRREVSRTPGEVRVFVCGYDSFRLLGAREDPVFLRALDFNFYQAVKDYHGYRMYLMVHQPTGAGAFESIHWKYPQLFTLGHRNLLYYRDWGDWRLFELVQAPRREDAQDGETSVAGSVHRKGHEVSGRSLE